MLSHLPGLLSMQGRTSLLRENISLHATNRNYQLNQSLSLENSKSELGTDYPEDEDMDVPEILEEIIEMLLSGLKDTVCLLVNFCSPLDYLV